MSDGLAMHATTATCSGYLCTVASSPFDAECLQDALRLHPRVAVTVVLVALAGCMAVFCAAGGCEEWAYSSPFQKAQRRLQLKLAQKQAALDRKQAQALHKPTSE